jgi:hypothetical protein
MSTSDELQRMKELLDERENIISDLDKNISNIIRISDLVEELRKDFKKAEEARLQLHIYWERRFQKLEQVVLQLQRK